MQNKGWVMDEKSTIELIQREIAPVIAGLRPDIQQQLSVVFSQASRAEATTAIFVQFQEKVGAALQHAIAQLEGRAPLELSSPSAQNPPQLPAASTASSNVSPFEATFRAVISVLSKEPTRSDDLRKQVAPHNATLFHNVMQFMRKREYVKITGGAKRWTTYVLSGDPSTMSLDQCIRSSVPTPHPKSEPVTKHSPRIDEKEVLRQGVLNLFAEERVVLASTMTSTLNVTGENRYLLHSVLKELKKGRHMKVSGPGRGARYTWIGKLPKTQK